MEDGNCQRESRHNYAHRSCRAGIRFETSQPGKCVDSCEGGQKRPNRGGAKNAPDRRTRTIAEVTLEFGDGEVIQEPTNFLFNNFRIRWPDYATRQWIDRVIAATVVPNPFEDSGVGVFVYWIAVRNYEREDRAQCRRESQQGPDGENNLWRLHRIRNVAHRREDRDGNRGTRNCNELWENIPEGNVLGFASAPRV